MDAWDHDAIDLLEPAFIEFDEDGRGEFAFVAVRGLIDYRAVERNGRSGVEFTWEGVDEEDPVSGRGWATLVDEALVEGELFFHLGDESGFRAEPMSRG
jgi:PAS domain-containing protein